MTLSLNSRIFVAGHQGMVGSAILRKLREQGYSNILIRQRDELDLLNQQAVADFFALEQPDAVFMAAAKVGGIHANNAQPAEFIYENIMIATNVIHHSYLSGVQKLLFLGASCIYPKLAEQPLKESALLTGTLEPTNEPYAVAKIAGIKLCESYNRQYGVDYRSIMPTNLYGPQDNFHPENSHVIPAMLRRFHDAVQSNADQVVVWGTGQPMREFMFVDDMAAASVYVMNLDSSTYQAHTQAMLSHINVGTGQDCTIRELAETIAKVTGYSGEIIFDSSKPDGAPRKLMDVSRLVSLGWQASFSLEEGLKTTYQWFLENQNNYRT